MDIHWPDWCRGIPSEARAALSASASPRRYRATAQLFLEGDPGHHAFVIQRGEVKLVTTADDGRELVLDVVGPRSILGELAAIDGKPRSASAVALTAVEAAMIPAEALREVGRDHPALFELLLVEVAQRLRASDHRQLEFGGDALGRVCSRLMEIAERQGTEAAIHLPVSQSDLAAWTGLSREAVVKSLAALRRLGWVQTEGRTIALLLPEEIRRRASR